VLEKRTGTQWDGDLWDHEVGELMIQHSETKRMVTCGLSNAREIVIKQLDDSTISSTFKGIRGSDGEEIKNSSVRTSIRLVANTAQVLVKVDDVIPGSDWRFRALHYPLRHFAIRTYQEEGYLAVPIGRDGYIIPSLYFPYPSPNFWIREDNSRELDINCSSLSMPWFGARKDNSSFIAIVEQGVDATLHVVANTNRWGKAYREGRKPSGPRILSGSVVWRASRGAFSYPRTIRYRFLPEGSYVEMAKAYRKVAQQNGKFLSLKDRIAQNPKVERLIGAVMMGIYGGYPHHREHPHMRLSYTGLKKIARDMKEQLGIQHAVINPWSIFGEQAPAFLPLNTRQGTIKELQSAADYITNAGYLFTPYTYYSAYHQESDAWDPKLEFRDNAGLNNEVSKWFRICPTQFVRLAESFIPDMMQQLSVDGVWVDIVTSGSIRECNHPDHPMSQQDDVAARRALYQYLKKQNLIIGSEAHKDWMFPLTDFAEGPGSRGGGIDGIGVRVPLLPLVYHDAIVSYTFCGEPYNAQVLTGGDYNLKSLWDILCGNAPHWHFVPAEYEYWRPLIKQSDDIVATFAREVGMQELTRHEFLSADYQVHRTTFAPSGTKVMVNLGAQYHRLEGNVILKPFSFRIETPGRKIRQGEYSFQIKQ
jgi:hypothetical protein